MLLEEHGGQTTTSLKTHRLIGTLQQGKKRGFVHKPETGLTDKLSAKDEESNL